MNICPKCGLRTNLGDHCYNCDCDLVSETAPASEEAVLLQRVVRELRAENKRLSESQTECRRIIAALVQEAGGEMRVDEVTLRLVPLDPEIITGSDPVARILIIRVGKTKLPNMRTQRQQEAE